MSKKIAQAAIGITAITLGSKLLGFLRDVCMASAYGTTMSSDAFIMAQSIIGVVTSIVFAALGTTFIPVYSNYLANENLESREKFTNNIYTFFIGFLVILAVLGLIFTKPLVFIFAPKFSTEAFNLTVKLTRVILPSVIILGCVTINSARLQSHGHFLIPAAVGYPQNIIMIATMIFFTKTFGIMGLAGSMLIGAVTQVVFQYPSLKRLGHKYHFVFDLNEPGLRKIGMLVVPILIGNGIQQINTMIDRMLASGLPEGSVAALNFSNRLVLFVVGLMSAVVASIYYTSMSHYYSKGKTDAFKNLLRNTINIMSLVVIPATVGFMVLRLPIVQLVFERGLFDSSASETTAVALFFYAIGLLGYSLRDVLSRAFYAIQDTKTAMINGSIGVALNIVLSITLVRFMGIGGLALGTSASGLISTYLLMFSLRKKIGSFGGKEICFTFIKVIIMSLVMGGCVYFTYGVILGAMGSNTVAVLLSIIIGVCTYGVMALFSRIGEVDMVVKLVLNKLGKHI